MFAYTIGQNYYSFTENVYFAIADSFLTAIIEFATIIEGCKTRLLPKIESRRTTGKQSVSLTKVELTPKHLRTVLNLLGH